MKNKVLFVERKPFESVSIERAFKQIAANLPDDLDVEFQQMPYGNRFSDTLRNLLFFRKRDADIYHITGQIHYISLLFSRRNTVLSIMDVRFLYRKPGLKRWVLQKLYLDWPIRKLDHITAISEKTKQEIIRYTKCDPKKISVLDLPLTIRSDRLAPREFNSKEPIILQVGTMENKNIANLAKALKGVECKLRVIGKLTAQQTAALREHEIDFSSVHDLTDERVQDEYRSCDIVAFCSTFEGFGLPIVEGQAMGKPVVTSNLSPMKDVSGGAAFLADPHDPESMREGFSRIIRDSVYRERLVHAGIQNVERFGPRNVAKQYENIYRKILAELRV